MLYDEHPHVKISIITVVYNAVDCVEITLKSVLDQDYDNLEYIVIDGGSADGTLGVLNRYRDRFAYFISERDGGIYDALNKGIHAAKGDWIGVMNAGDVFSSNDVLRRVFLSGSDFAGVDVVYGDAVAIDGGRRQKQIAPIEVNGLASGPVYRHGASFVRASTHRRFLFDLSLHAKLGFALDFEQIFRMYRSGCVFCKTDVTIVDYKARGASTVSPFKPGYYTYLITHGMRCTWLMRAWLVVLAIFRKAKSLI